MAVASKFRKKMYEGSEQELMNSMIKGLELRGFYAQRVNSGALKLDGNRYVKLFPKGTPDILAIYYGKAYWFEVKKPGEESTPHQEAMQEKLRGKGCKVWVVTSWTEVQEAIDSI